MSVTSQLSSNQWHVHSWPSIQFPLNFGPARGDAPGQAIIPRPGQYFPPSVMSVSSRYIDDCAVFSPARDGRTRAGCKPGAPGSSAAVRRPRQSGPVTSSAQREPRVAQPPSAGRAEWTSDVIGPLTGGPSAPAAQTVSARCAGSSWWRPTLPEKRGAVSSLLGTSRRERREDNGIQRRSAGGLKLAAIRYR